MKICRKVVYNCWLKNRVLQNYFVGKVLTFMFVENFRNEVD